MRRGRASIGTAVLLVGTVLSLPAVSGRSETPSGPVALIEQTVDEVIAVLNDASLDSPGRRKRIEEIAYERFDFETMSKLVIARYWKRFDPEQRDAFIREFKAFLARTYGARIDRYNREHVKVVGERPEGKADVVVMTRIVGGEYNDAVVDYRLRELSGHWRVIDVKVEGISLVLNYRDQFKSVLSRKGPDGLLETLREKNAQGDVDSS